MSRRIATACALVVLLTAPAALTAAWGQTGSTLRISAVQAAIGNLPGDGFLEVMQRYDPGITQEAIADCLEARLREQLGPDRAGLMNGATGATLQMTLTLSVDKWERVTRGVVRCKGVTGRSITVIDPGSGAAPVTLEANAGWVICTEDQMLCIRKTIDQHIGILLSQLAMRNIATARILPLLPELLPLSQSSPGGVRFSRYQPQGDSLWDVLARMVAARGSASIAGLLRSGRDEIRWAAVTALGAATDGQAEAPLINALSDNHFGVREAAANGLGSVGTASAITPLKQRQAIETDADVRKAIARALAKLGALPVRVITAPEGVAIACVPYYDPAGGTVWCVPEPVLAHYQLPTTLPASVQRQTLQGRSVVDLAELVARVPELKARITVVTTHVSTQRKVYLKRR